MIEALLWDVDGTLAETEREGHRVAFNRAFEAMGLTWRWDERRYGELLRTTGGRERLLADMGARAEAPVAPAERAALAAELHRRKNQFYEAIVHDGDIPLRAGVRELVEEASARGLRQAIVTTTSRVNVEALLRRHFGAERHRCFERLVCAENVAAKKPDPEAYVQALAALGLSPLVALAIEGSAAGAAAACAADIPVVVTRSEYFAQEAVDSAVAIGPGLHTRRGWRPATVGAATGRVRLDDMIEWHGRMEFVSHFG